MDPKIQVISVSKRYGEHHVNAVRDVSLAVQPGEFVALMGPSGCGKSTLLNLMGAIDRPTSGQILMDGRDLAVLDEQSRTALRREKLGFVFQFFNLLTTLTVFENVALPLELGLPHRNPATDVQAMLAAVGMRHRADFYPAQLSGGEMQRVAIARALVHRPEVILADEPTGNLDTENGKAVLDLLSRLSKEYGQTILMATHSEEAAGVADRIVRMRDGRLQ